MEEKWVYHSPIFESDDYNEILLKYAPWSGLRGFAYDLVSFMRPECIVELGSHYGCSSFSFLQAIKDNSLETRFYAIDTWEGDSYTEYSDVEKVYEAYSEIEDNLFYEQNSYRLRCRFDEAAGRFSDDSIDILHIDGSHRYEDVKKDYHTWYDKVKRDGIILLHDISTDLVDGKLMGSHFFWQELKESCANTMEIPFSCGLGIVFKNRDIMELLEKAFSIEHYQQQNNLQDTINKEAVRTSWFRINGLNEYIKDLKKQLDNLDGHIRRYEVTTAEKDSYIKDLGKQVDDYKKTVLGKERYIKELLQQVKDLNEFANSKEQYAKKLENDNKQLNIFAGEKESYIQELQGQIKTFFSDIETKGEYADKLLQDIASLNAYAESKENYISELNQSIDALNRLLSSKEDYISELKQTITLYEESVKGKESYIKELESDREQLNAFAEEKEQYIYELQSRIDLLKESVNNRSWLIRQFFSGNKQ